MVVSRWQDGGYPTQNRCREPMYTSSLTRYVAVYINVYSLDDPSIEPTNNRAERALRGAVIARKVSHCSKNAGGADAFSAFTSVIRTLTLPTT